MELTFNYTTGPEKMDVPTSWGEVSFSKYCDLLENDNATLPRRISIMLGIPETEVESLPAGVAISIGNCLSFISDMAPIREAGAVIPVGFEKFDVGFESWGKYEDAQKVLATYHDKTEYTRAAVEIVKIYTAKGDEPGRDISNEPVTEVLGLATFFLAKLIVFSQGTQPSEKVITPPNNSPPG